MSRSGIKSVAPFLLRVWEKQTRKKYKRYLHWPEFKEFWDDHCGVAGHAWEKVAADTEECFDCGQQRDPEPPPIAWLDDEFRGCPDVEGYQQWARRSVPKKSLLAKFWDWAKGKR